MAIHLPSTSSTWGSVLSLEINCMGMNPGRSPEIRRHPPRKNPGASPDNDSSGWSDCSASETEEQGWGGCDTNSDSEENSDNDSEAAEDSDN